MRLVCIILLLLGNLQLLQAQDGFLVMKKKNITRKTWMTGSTITFTLNTGQKVTGLFMQAKKDSFFVRSYQILRYENEKGFVFLDTIYGGRAAIAVDDVVRISVASRKKAALLASEYTAYAAAAWFGVMSIVNSAKFEDTRAILGEVATRSGGLFLLGRLIRLGNRTEFKMGRKYKLATVVF
jgi:hypothetical protein